MCSIYCCLVAFLWNLIKRTGSATFSTQQNHTVYSARGETRGEFESGLVSEGMRPFHRCVTQIKPDRKVPSCGELRILQAVSRFLCSPANVSNVFLSPTLSMLYWLLTKWSSRPSSWPTASDCVTEMSPSSRKFKAFIARNGLIGWLRNPIRYPVAARKL